MTADSKAITDWKYCTGTSMVIPTALVQIVAELLTSRELVGLEIYSVKGTFRSDLLRATL